MRAWARAHCGQLFVKLLQFTCQPPIHSHRMMHFQSLAFPDALDLATSRSR